MNDSPTAAPAVPNLPSEACIELLKKKQVLAQELASRLSQIHAIDQAIEVLHENAHNETIHLELTKGKAATLMTTCWNFARHTTELPSERRELIELLGTEILKALYYQNEQFARGINECYNEKYGAAHGYVGARGQPVRESQLKLPKRLKPYLRYSEDQVKEAWQRSSLACRRHYACKGYVRLYLDREMLMEMYESPRHLKTIYAALLQSLDESRPDSASKIIDVGESEPSLFPVKPKFKPYEELDGKIMRSALRKMGIMPGSVRTSYGFLAISLGRDPLFHLYKNLPHVQPVIAYLLMRFDGMKQG